MSKIENLGHGVERLVFKVEPLDALVLKVIQADVERLNIIKDVTSVPEPEVQELYPGTPYSCDYLKD